MASTDFKHLPLPFRARGPARLQSPSTTKKERTVENEKNRTTHGAKLRKAASDIVSAWKVDQTARPEGAPPIPPGIALLLEIAENADLEFLRSMFGFEVVSEQEDGFVIVTTEDVDLGAFQTKVQEFESAAQGTGGAAKVYELHSDSNRIERILSPELYARWPKIQDTGIYEVEVGVACLGTTAVPDPPRPETDKAYAKRLEEFQQQRKGETKEKYEQRIKNPPKKKGSEQDERFPDRIKRWQAKLDEAYAAWDELREQREKVIFGLVAAYQGQVLGNYDEGSSVSLPDSFTVHLRITGKGLRDLVLNVPWVFEVVLPEEVERGGAEVAVSDAKDAAGLKLTPPDDNAPAICIVDSGVQEGHRLLAAAIDGEQSWCYVPGEKDTDVADAVLPSGHGTRIAGVVLFGEHIPSEGVLQLPFWIQNARILDQNNALRPDLFPASCLKQIVARFHEGARKTRIYNHSVAGRYPFRRRHMSSWAAEIDRLSAENDLLFIQAAGNLEPTSSDPFVRGIRERLAEGAQYPDYLLLDASRVPNPAHAFHALTVGSIAHSAFEKQDLRSLSGPDRPASYSRTGLGMWGSIKPDVVEVGGDYVVDGGDPPSVRVHSETACHLVRSTHAGAGPETDSDEVGTSYATPRVTRLVGQLAELLPNEPTLLYRALVGHAARWPDWCETAEDKLKIIRHLGYGRPDPNVALTNDEWRVTLITSGDRKIQAREAHVYQVPIPKSLRAPGGAHRIRIDVTLAYVANPRRTRRQPRGYLSTWVDWATSNRGEALDAFASRVLKEFEVIDSSSDGVIPWHLRKREDYGLIDGVRRNLGTLQKDWAVVPSYDLPETFAIAVVGHPGWDKRLDASARYALVVGFEAIDQDVDVYVPISQEVEQLIEQEAEVEIEIE